MTANTSTLRKKSGKTRKTTKKTAKKVAAGKAASKKKTVKKTATKKTGGKKATAAAGKKAATRKTAVKKPVAGGAKKKAASKKKTTTAKSPSRRSRANVVSGPGLASTYQSRKGEQYMNPTQLEHFRQKLLTWRQEIVADLGETINNLKGGSANLADPNDRATLESEFALELRTRDRERKLLKKIAQALARINDGSYGYCEETGEKIGVARLEIRPVATLCVEAQERRERAERQFVDAR